MGLQGTITKKAQAQYGNLTRWVVDLDNGKRLVLTGRYLRKIN